MTQGFANAIRFADTVGMRTSCCCVYLDPKLAAYHFGDCHPFGPQRHAAFEQALYRQQLQHDVRILPAADTDRDSLLRFHSEAYIDRVVTQSRSGEGYLDRGDTPAFTGMYDAVLTVAGTVLDAIDRLMNGACQRAFVPIAGLHHARRDRAAGFCVVNDCGVAIETLLTVYGLRRIAYVDIDAHHGDGVFYSFETDARVIFADMHEDGRYLYPGTGAVTETGRGDAAGTKLNIPMPPGADDDLFSRLWQQVEHFIEKQQPQFIILQCGADSLHGDPITDLAYSEKSHALAAARLRSIADRHCGGKLLALGGGGYKLDNIARAWTAVVRALAA